MEIIKDIDINNYPLKSELNLKGIDTDAEACVIKVGVVDFLDRPVMAFIRLKNSQLIGNYKEIYKQV